MTDISHDLRILEAFLFAADEPQSEDSLAERLPEGSDVPSLLKELAGSYDGHGVVLKRVAGKWAFRTAEDLAPHLRIEKNVARKPSRAAIETLAIISYHQPVTRAEVEQIRGVAVSKGSFDVLLEAGWIKPVGRRRTPGRPVTWGTTEMFLEHFGLSGLADLPGMDELKAAGLLDVRPASVISGNVSNGSRLPDPIEEDEEAIPPLDAGDDADLDSPDPADSKAMNGLNGDFEGSDEHDSDGPRQECAPPRRRNGTADAMEPPPPYAERAQAPVEAD